MIVGLLAAIPAPKELPPTDFGYLRCDTRHLNLCENSNELFSGPPRSYVRKHDFTGKLARFLLGAPSIQEGGSTFTAMHSVEDAFIGPDQRAQLPGGEWFFSGFTPHYAPDKAAIIFDSRGEILLAASLLKKIGTGEFELRIYGRGGAARRDLISYLERWGRDHVTGESPYPGLPTEVFGGTTLIIRKAQSQRWVIDRSGTE